MHNAAHKLPDSAWQSCGHSMHHLSCAAHVLAPSCLCSLSTPAWQHSAQQGLEHEGHALTALEV